MKKKYQGAYSQRYSNYLMGDKIPSKDKEAQQDTPLETPSFTVSVAFNKDMGNVTGNGLENGSVTVKSGDSITLTATPKSGYRFVKWTGVTAVKDTNPVLTFNVLSNSHITAVFATVDPVSGTVTNVFDSVIGPAISVYDVVPPSAKAFKWKAILRKYWWVLAILVGYYLYKEGKL